MAGTPNYFCPATRQTTAYPFDGGATEPREMEKAAQMKFDNQVLDNLDESIHTQPDFEPTGPPVREESHAVGATGFGQVFGLHPIPAVTTLAVNAMLFGGQVMTLGALTVVALAVAVVLGVITYKAQMRFYGDDARRRELKRWP